MCIHVHVYTSIPVPVLQEKGKGPVDQQEPASKKSRKDNHEEEDMVGIEEELIDNEEEYAEMEINRNVDSEVAQEPNFSVNLLLGTMW